MATPTSDALVRTLEDRRDAGRVLRLELDRLEREILEGDAETGVQVLGDVLQTIASTLGPRAWAGELVPICRAHSLAERLREDPYTARAWEKPRGYAGDAVTLDFVYDAVPPAGTSELGRRLFAGTVRSSSGRSVVARRDRLASAIDHVLERRPGARILSIACGHLREAQVARRVGPGCGARITALDQDREALEVVGREQAAAGVEPVEGSVRSLVSGRHAFQDMDLVYAAGLTDYLSDPLVGRLIARMVSFLAPGGRAIVGNFLPGNAGRAYMEAFMDWHLIHRSAADLRSIARASGAVEHVRVERVDVDALGNIGYLELIKA